MKRFCLFLKRSFKHLSFILILLIMPITALLVKELTLADDSAVKIGYLSSGEPDSALADVFSKIEKDDGIMRFVSFDSEKSGKKALESSQIDSLWIFEGDLEESLRRYRKNSSHPVVTVLNREENETYHMALEKLFCFIYPHLSYTLFEEYMKNDIEGGDKLSDATLRQYYGYKGIDSELVEIKTVDNSGRETSEEKSFILTALRGILSLMVLLSALSSALFLKEDEERGLYLRFKPLARLSIYFEAILSALIPTGVVFLVSVLLSGTFTEPVKEVLSLILLLLTSASLSVALVTICSSKRVLCVVFPLILTASAILSPIFLNVRAFPVIQSLFPTYHYLYSLTNSAQLVYSVIYFAVATAIALSTEYFYCRKR